jgi:hypothetical protein
MAELPLILAATNFAMAIKRFAVIAAYMGNLLPDVSIFEIEII